VGRHLSENETTLIDQDGNRLLDQASKDVLAAELEKNAATGDSCRADASDQGFAASSFERGPDITLADDSISRAHAMIFYDQEGVGVVDLASKNGTFVDADRISCAIVADGHQIIIGNSSLRVSLS